MDYESFTLEAYGEQSQHASQDTPRRFDKMDVSLKHVFLNF